MQETQEMQVQSLGWEDTLEEEMATRCSILAGEFHGQRGLVGCSRVNSCQVVITHVNTLWGHKELETIEHAHTHKCIF